MVLLRSGTCFPRGLRRGRIRMRAKPGSGGPATKERSDEQDEENHEEDLRDDSGGSGDDTEAKSGGDQGDDEKKDTIAEHGRRETSDWVGIARQAEETERDASRPGEQPAERREAGGVGDEFGVECSRRRAGPAIDAKKHEDDSAKEDDEGKEFAHSGKV